MALNEQSLLKLAMIYGGGMGGPYGLPPGLSVGGQAGYAGSMSPPSMTPPTGAKQMLPGMSAPGQISGMQGPNDLLPALGPAAGHTLPTNLPTMPVPGAGAMVKPTSTPTATPTATTATRSGGIPTQTGGVPRAAGDAVIGYAGTRPTTPGGVDSRLSPELDAMLRQGWMRNPMMK